MTRITALVLGLIVGLVVGVTTAPPAVAAPGLLAGVVRDSSGAPVPDAQVGFYAESVTNPDSQTPIQQVRADATGHWEVSVSAEALPPGRYKVRAVDAWARAGWYPAERSPGTATVIEAVADTNSRGLDITVLGPPTVGGRVTSAGGSPVAGALVTLYPAGFALGGDLSAYQARATTDQQGRWQLESADLLPGSYLVRAGHPDHDARWLGGATPEQATVVTVGADTDRNSLDISLGRLASLAGYVWANGSRIPDMTVTARPLLPPGPEVLADQLATTTVDAGHYELALPTGQYRLEVSDPQGELPTRWYPRALEQERGTPVTFTSGQTRAGLKLDASFQPVFPGRPRAHPKGLRAPRGVTDRDVDPITDYDPQKNCRPRPKPGTVALSRLLHRRFGPITIGLSRACQGDRSEHYDGRALDWMVNSRVPSQARKGDDFVKWLTMSRGRHLAPMARRLGIMYLIWRDRIWGVYRADEGWRPYNNCMTRAMRPRYNDNDCHRNHVHISLTWAGARKHTSWWRG